MALFRWLNTGDGRLVTGGQLLAELEVHGEFRKWAREATLAGRMRTLDEHAVERRANELKTGGALASNDHHVVAVAQLSGARLLATNDDDLIADFKTKRLIDNPRGKVFKTKDEDDLPMDFGKNHRALLNTASCSK